MGAYGHPLEDQDREAREETTRRTSIHDTDKLTSGHSAPDFAHAHQPLKKLIHSSGHSVKKKSRKISDKAEQLEGIQEKEGRDNPDPPILEEEEDFGESKPSSLPWRQAGGEEEGTLAMVGAEIPSSGGVRDVGDGGGEGSHVEEDTKRGGSVLFEIGDDEGEEEPSDHRKKHKKSSHHHPHSHREHFNDRYRVGSDLSSKLATRQVTTEEEPAVTEHDREDIGAHRFDKQKTAHKIDKAKERKFQVGAPVVPEKYGHQSTLDHTPHELFVEMDELEGEQWVERARWIKYEEDLNAEKGQWGKPHVATLSFKALVNLRLCMEGGTLMLDVTVRDLPELLHRVVEDLSEHSIIEEEQKEKVLSVLLYRHKHVHPHNNTFKFGLKRSMSQRSIQGLLDDGRRASTIAMGLNKQDKDHLVVDMNGTDLKRSSTQSSFGKGLKRSDSFVEEERHQKRRHDILACLEEGTEGCITLVGSIDDIDRPVVAFVRMAEAIALPNTIEVSLPVRFVIIILTPTMDMEYDAHEIGRSISTLMSNQAFHNVCYNAQEKRDLLHGINEFLGDSVVLPPGDWDKAHLLHMGEMIDMKNKMKARKATLIHQQAVEEGTKPAAAGAPGGGDGGDEKNPEKGGKGPRNPLKRTTTALPCNKTKMVTLPFGGLIDDIKHRYISYKSDILDGLNTQCIAAAIFIYFAALSGAIAFGGLMGAKTDNHIGISETLIVSSVAGIVFSLFAGCPLIIIGVTGPVLLYDEALYGFSLDLFPIPSMFLYWRVWIGIWTFVIALLVAGLQGSTLVRFFTKFTKDIFAGLVALLFIFEAFNKLVKIFRAHPLQETYDYCSHLPDHCHAFNDSSYNETRLSCTADKILETSKSPQPNTALMSMILMFGTFFIAYFLRLFRNSQYLGRNARRALGDFGVPIAIVIMVLVDWSAGDTFTEKLTVPEGISVTNSTLRSWVIPATGTVEHPLPVWAMFAAVIPAVLLYLLLFMETHICELIMMEKTKEKKGAGLHLDIVLLSLINLVSGAIGGPWICAATVRAVSHVSALTVMSTTHVPGEAPKVVGIRDQRMTAFAVSVLLGLSVLLAPILKLVPFAVLFGVFLYMGVSGMNGVQFFDRVSLCFMPVKHHPPVSYVQNVKTWRMVLFTVLQAFGLALLWVVKSFKQIALTFPFFVILMIPYRYLLKFIFTERELSALDGAQAGTNLSGLKPDEEEKDFFETAAECPIAPNTEAPLHRLRHKLSSVRLSKLNKAPVLEGKPEESMASKIPLITVTVTDPSGQCADAVD